MAQNLIQNFTPLYIDLNFVVDNTMMAFQGLVYGRAPL